MTNMVSKMQKVLMLTQKQVSAPVNLRGDVSASTILKGLDGSLDKDVAAADFVAVLRANGDVFVIKNFRGRSGNFKAKEFVKMLADIN